MRRAGSGPGVEPRGPAEQAFFCVLSRCLYVAAAARSDVWLFFVWDLWSMGRTGDRPETGGPSGGAQSDIGLLDREAMVN